MAVMGMWGNREVLPMKEKWSKRIEGFFSSRNMALLLTVTYIVSLLPILWIARYNYPSADDYTNGSSCHHVWEASHSLVQVAGMALSRTVSEWFEWRGCFTSSFLSALTPNIFGEKCYFLTTWLVLGMLSFSVIYLFHMLFCRMLGVDKYRSCCISMLTLFITVQCIGKQERVEAFFWYSGAINYVFIHGVSLLFFGLLLALFLEKEKKHRGILTAASLLGFLVGGGNQMTMLNVAIVLAVIVAIITIQKKWSGCKPLVLPIGMFYFSFILSVIAPGNFIRAGSAAGMNPIKAIMVSFYYSLDLAFSQWMAWPLLLVILAMIPIFWRMAHDTNFLFPYPMIVVMFGFCLVSAMFTPPLYAVGNIEAGRLRALAFIMYVLVLVLCVGYVTGWLRKKYEKRCGGRAEESHGKSGVKEGHLYLFGCMVFFLWGSVLTIIPEPHYYTFSSAVVDLTNGSAASYAAAREERIAKYLSKPEGVLEIEAIEAQPSLLFFSDVKEDVNDWENQGLCRFYGLEAVKVKGQNQ